ncbi:C-C chemokine receptor-like 2 isoform 1-T2 [Thomomys bottae]
MADYTVAPEDEYDVLIQDEMDNETVHAGSCDTYPTSILTAQQTTWIFSSICAVGLLDNIFIAFLLVKYKAFQHLGPIYFLHFAISNFCFLLPLPIWAHLISHPTHGKELMCKILTGCHSVALYGKIFFIILLLLQQYQAFSHVAWLSPGLETRAGKLITSILAWGLAIVLNLPEFAFYTPPLESHRFTCDWYRTPFFPPAADASWNYFLTLKMNIFTLVFPLMVWLFCGIRIRRTLTCGAWKSDLSRLLFILMFIFLLLWTPYNVMLLSALQPLAAGLQDCEKRQKLETGIQVTRITAITHCGVSAIFSLLMNIGFRSHACKLNSSCDSYTLESGNQNMAASSSSRQYRDHTTQI